MPQQPRKPDWAKLSGERVQKEVLKLLAAEDPAPVLRIMAASEFSLSFCRAISI